MRCETLEASCVSKLHFSHFSSLLSVRCNDDCIVRFIGGDTLRRASSNFIAGYLGPSVVVGFRSPIHDGASFHSRGQHDCLCLHPHGVPAHDIRFVPRAVITTHRHPSRFKELFDTILSLALTRIFILPLRAVTRGAYIPQSHSLWMLIMRKNI